MAGVHNELPPPNGPQFDEPGERKGLTHPVQVATDMSETNGIVVLPPAIPVLVSPLFVIMQMTAAPRRGWDCHGYAWALVGYSGLFDDMLLLVTSGRFWQRGVDQDPR